MRPSRRGDGMLDATSIDYALVTSIEGFADLAHEWDDLYARSGRSAQLFQTHSWLSAWARHFVDRGLDHDARINVLIGRQAGRLVMAWPLAIKRARGVSSLIWLGEPVGQYGDVLIDDTAVGPSALRNAFAFLIEHSRVDLLRLRKVRDDAAIARLLPELGGLELGRQAAPYIDLGSRSFRQYLERFSSKDRKNRRRQLRRFEELGAATFTLEEAGPRAAALTANALALKRAWLEARSRLSPALADPRTSQFFDTIAQRTDAHCAIRVFSLALDGKPVAISVAFISRGRMAAHVIAHDHAYDRMAPGSLLMEHMIENAFDQGLAVFDFLAPADAYKCDWADEAAGIADYALPLTMKGNVYARLLGGPLREALKDAVGRVPSPVRRKLMHMARL